MIPKSFFVRSRRKLGRWCRCAKYQWQNGNILTDVIGAPVLFIIILGATYILPDQPTTFDWPDKVVLVCCVISLLMMVFCFMRVRSYLKDDAAYEDLRTEKRPFLGPIHGLFLRFPFSAVALFAPRSHLKIRLGR
jgi:Na+/melibiose symporter-like transporter